VKPRDALLLIVAHALDTAGEHLDFWKTEIIDGILMRGTITVEIGALTGSSTGSITCTSRLKKSLLISRIVAHFKMMGGF
jgi:hypothetical protein